MTKPSEDEIRKMAELARVFWKKKPTELRRVDYGTGVESALRWALGESDRPLEDDNG